jgi:crotonobetainyl-CoA:carnitine CoA-transferase CaiB-like acyl-CoA transferase
VPEAGTEAGPPQGQLAGLTGLDVATIYAGPFSAMLPADFGAEVITVEHPRGDPVYGHLGLGRAEPAELHRQGVV